LGTFEPSRCTCTSATRLPPSDTVLCLLICILFAVFGLLSCSDPRHLAAKAGRSKSVAAQPEEDDETALPPKSIVHLDKKDFTIEQLSNKVRLHTTWCYAPRRVVTTSGNAVQSVAAEFVKQHQSLDLEIVLLQVGKEDLDLQPAYQRGLVWDKKMASRLVVTALEERVLPAVFLEEGGCQQRYKHSMHLVSACISQQVPRSCCASFRVLTSKYA
jgi:hypothetical protein